MAVLSGTPVDVDWGLQCSSVLPQYPKELTKELAQMYVLGLYNAYEQQPPWMPLGSHNALSN
jgi:hypothetical protein